MKYKTGLFENCLLKLMVEIHLFQEETKTMFTFGSCRLVSDSSREDAFIKMHKNCCVARLV